jgi:hypothetical protein
MSLRVGAVLVEAAIELKKNHSALLKALVAPAIAIVAVNLAYAEMRESMLATLALTPVGLWFHSLFAVSCHRITLLGEAHLPNRWGLYASAPVWRFFGAMLAILFFFVIASILLFAFLLPFFSAASSSTGMIIGMVVFALGAILFLCAFARVVLLFPAVAIDSGQTMSDILDLTRPRWVRLAMLVGIPVIVTSVITFPLTRLAQQADTLLYPLIQSALSCVIGAYCVATISCAYRAIEADSPSTSRAETQAPA